jgi:hypothetical protein
VKKRRREKARRKFVARESRDELPLGSLLRDDTWLDQGISKHLARRKRAFLPGLDFLRVNETYNLGW